MAVVLMFFQHRGAARGEWAMFAGVLEPVDMDIPLVFFHSMDRSGKFTTKVAGRSAIHYAAIRSVFNPDVVF